MSAPHAAHKPSLVCSTALHFTSLSTALQNGLQAIAILPLQVRDYEFSEERQQSQQESSQSLRTETEEKRNQMEEWSSTAYGEVGHSTQMLCLLLHCVWKNAHA